jgi:CheY-like chemotaxis protein
MGRAFQARQRTILCIDDDDGIVRYVSSLFERSGCRVLTTTSSTQGLTIAMMSQIDAVVLDYHMPEMNGHEIAAEIKRHRPEIVVVMFSGGEIPEATCNLADAVVRKTDAADLLLPTVMQLCERPSPSL